ncbi:MAG TPA: hypothetical protein VFJ16_31240 [Longimicrobium sp.]|nr:hypothetical protein [Longimicrobium sp.]
MTPRAATGLWTKLRENTLALAALLTGALALANGAWSGASRVHDMGAAPERLDRVEARVDSITDELKSVKASSAQDRKVLYYTACRVDGQAVALCAGKYLAGMDRP